MAASKKIFEHRRNEIPTVTTRWSQPSPTLHVHLGWWMISRDANVIYYCSDREHVLNRTKIMSSTIYALLRVPKWFVNHCFHQLCTLWHKNVIYFSLLIQDIIILDTKVCAMKIGPKWSSFRTCHRNQRCSLFMITASILLDGTRLCSCYRLCEQIKPTSDEHLRKSIGFLFGSLSMESPSALISSSPPDSSLVLKILHQLRISLLMQLRALPGNLRDVN